MGTSHELAEIGQANRYDSLSNFGSLSEVDILAERVLLISFFKSTMQPKLGVGGFKLVQRSIIL